MTRYAVEPVNASGYGIGRPIPLPDDVRSFRAAVRYVRRHHLLPLGCDLSAGDRPPVRVVQLIDETKGE